MSMFPNTMQNDLRFSALINSVTAQVMCELEPCENARDLYEIAFRTASLMLSRIYNEDAEIRALRYERDLYKKMIEESLMFSPTPVILHRDKD